MKIQNPIAFIGAFASAGINYLILELWAADWLADLMNVSRDTVLHTALTFLILFTLCRAWNIARDKDSLTKWIDKKFIDKE